MISLNPATILASQLAAGPLAHGRFLAAPRGGVSLAREDLVMWVNPMGGGGRGKQIAERYEQQLRQIGLTIVHLNPAAPEKIIQKSLEQRPTGNVFILETVTDRSERIASLARVFQVTGGNGASAPIGLPMGGDGTIAEMMEAAYASLGVSAREMLDGDEAGVAAKLEGRLLPRIVPVKRAGSAADYAKEGNGPGKDIISFFKNAVAVPVACAVAAPMGSEDVYLTPHTLNLGFGAEIFRRGDRTKFGWLRGNPLNYQLRIPGILGGSAWAFLVKRIMSHIPLMGLAVEGVELEQPIRNLLVRYRVDGEDVVEVLAQDVLMTGLRHVGGGLLIPHTPRDGVAILLTGNMIGALPATAEVKLRGAMHDVTGDQGGSALMGNQIALLSPDRQLVLHPGQKIDLMILDREGHPDTAALQVNGQFMDDVRGVSIAVTQPYPGFLVAPESRLDQQHDPAIEAARPVVRDGLLAYLGTEVVKYLASTTNPAATAALLTAAGMVMARKAPRASVTGLLLAPIAVGALEAVHRLQDYVGMEETGWGRLERHSSSALAVYLSLAVVLRLLARAPLFRKVITGDYRLTQTERPSKRLPEILAYGASAVLGGLYYFLS